MTAFISLLYLWLCSTPWVVNLSAKLLLSDAVIKTPLKELTDIDAIVVFSWIAPVKKTLSNQYFHYEDKLHHVKSVYNKHKVPIIIGSSFYPIQRSPSDTEIEYARIYLQMLGVKAEDIYVAISSRNSYEGGLAVRDTLNELGVKSFVIVETDLRMPRKYFVFKKLYQHEPVKILAYTNAMGIGMGEIKFSYEHWIPNVYSLELMTTVIHDWLGLMAYRFLGWT